MGNVTKLKEGAGSSSLTLMPTTMDEALKFSEVMANSSIVPKDYQGKPGNVLVALQWGMEVGLMPLQAMQNIAVINGRPSLWGDAVIGLVRGSKLLESMEETVTGEGDEMVAVCRVKRIGEDPLEREFTMEDAKTAGLKGKQGPWQQYPKRMLQLRARGFALRDAFPDVLRGMWIAEEARDTPAEPKDITPPEEAERGVEGVKKKLAAKKTTAKRPAKKKEPKEDVVEKDLKAVILEKIDAATTEDQLKGAIKGSTVDIEDLSIADQDEVRPVYRRKLGQIIEAQKKANPPAGDGTDMLSLIQKEIDNGAPLDATLTFYQEQIDAMDEDDRVDLLTKLEANA